MKFTEQEKADDCFSPQIDNKELNTSDKSKPSHAANTLSDLASPSCITNVGKVSSKMDSSSSATSKENDSSVISVNRTFERISIKDVLCPSCQQLLYRPAVLNCGHGTF